MVVVPHLEDVGQLFKPSNSANSSSTPCNNVSDISLVAWTDAGNINYKMTPFIGPNGYNFRTTHGGTTTSPPSTPIAIGAQDRLAIYPNPANDHLTIENPVTNSHERQACQRFHFLKNSPGICPANSPGGGRFFRFLMQCNILMSIMLIKQVFCLVYLFFIAMGYHYKFTGV